MSRYFSSLRPLLRGPKELRKFIAEGFTERQWKRDQKRLRLNERKVAWAQKRRSASKAEGAKA